MSKKWYSIGYWEQPLLFTSWDSEFSQSQYAQALSPGLEGGLKVASREFFFNNHDIQFFKKLAAKPGFMNDYIRAQRKALRTFASLIVKHSPAKIKNQQEALELFSLYVKANIDLAYFVNTGFPIERALMPKIIRQIDQPTVLQLVKSDKEVDLHRELKSLKRIAALLKNKFGSSLAKLGVHTLLRRISNRSSIRRALQAHAALYSYLPTHTFRGQPWSLIDYIERAKTIQLPPNRQAKMLSIKPRIDTETKRLIQYIKTLNELRTERIEYLNKWVWKLEPLWQYLERTLGVSRNEFLGLTYGEVIESVANGKLTVSRRELKLRDRAYLSIWENGKFTYHASRPKKQTIQSARILRGVAAHKGQTTGIVRVVRGVDDFSQFKPGEILVASHTTPNFVAVMAKAGAIITDLGGLTSHAAVVARELGVPCIIDTKIATKVFKDGDRVEVDAIKGIVRKII